MESRIYVKMQDNLKNRSISIKYGERPEKSLHKGQM